jgi:hypothetical protein
MQRAHINNIRTSVTTHKFVGEVSPVPKDHAMKAHRVRGGKYPRIPNLVTT